MSEIVALDILLHDRRIGRIAGVEGDRSIFAFDDDYLADQDRPTLSLAYRDEYGGLVNDPRAYQTKLEPFFSNLLPEGVLRDYLAKRAGVKAAREFQLLAALGNDLPGAIRAVPVEGTKIAEGELTEEAAKEIARQALRFSLAGVQLKFSGLKRHGKNGGLTIPASGSGGDWIIKLPSSRHANVPENEFASMSLAARLGIDVPEIDLIATDLVEGLPEGLDRFGTSAFAIRRFDRSEEGAVHTEDFAQVYSVYPDDKYENASYRSILTVLAAETDDTSIIEFIRRLTYSVLIGNGDMHLKNWSLIYPDRRRPILSPAYDLLSTVPYIPDDESALKFLHARNWDSFTYDELIAIADKARVASQMIVDAAKETVEKFDDLWTAAKVELPFTDDVTEAIERHRGKLSV
jgi:serine/threonine-protein kinase HipA